MNLDTARRKAARRIGGRLGAALAYQPDARDVDVWERIETQRKVLNQNATPMTTHNAKTVGEMAQRASVDAKRARMLYALAKVWNPARVLEMGTCCGVSTAYITTATAAPVRTLELSPVLADTAREFLSALNLTAEVVVGDFADTFHRSLDPPPDLVFVDGNHHLEPTVDYWTTLSRLCPPGSLLVFDDIDWSDGMRQAWRIIQGETPRAVAVAGTGLVVL